MGNKKLLVNRKELGNLSKVTCVAHNRAESRTPSRRSLCPLPLGSLLLVRGERSRNHETLKGATTVLPARGTGPTGCRLWRPLGCWVFAPPGSSGRANRLRGVGVRGLFRDTAHLLSCRSGLITRTSQGRWEE